MDERRLLADRFTPPFLMGLCDGLTDFQAQDILRPFIGEWIRVSGALEFATPNPAFGTVGVTIVFPSDDQRRDAFLLFERDLDNLAEIGIGEAITAEGRIKSISSHAMVLENCGLADPRIVAIRDLTARAKELGKAAKDWAAAPHKRARPEPGSDPNLPAPKADKRKNLSPAESEKFCRLLLDGWPSTTERDAYQKAVAFFAQNKVPKHAFLDVFRAIRGPRNPGPQPRSTELSH